MRAVIRTVTESQPVTIDEVRGLARESFGDMIKGVVDLQRGILLLDADLHADQEAALLADGSAQRDLWGINLYPDADGADWLEFDSMFNLRPSFGNRSHWRSSSATSAARSAVPRRGRHASRRAPRRRFTGPWTCST